VLLLVAKTTPIRLKATGTLGTINEGVNQEVDGVEIEVAKAKDVAIRAKTNHVKTLRFRRIILRTSY
jgi:hypothetical protein